MLKSNAFARGELNVMRGAMGMRLRFARARLPLWAVARARLIKQKGGLTRCSCRPVAVPSDRGREFAFLHVASLPTCVALRQHSLYRKERREGPKPPSLKTEDAAFVRARAPRASFSDTASLTTMRPGSVPVLCALRHLYTRTIPAIYSVSTPVGGCRMRGASARGRRSRAEGGARGRKRRAIPLRGEE